MPSRSVRRLTVPDSTDFTDCPLRVCDVIVAIILILALVFTGVSVYNQSSIEGARLQQESILCIKDFDSSGCNPFNMTPTCS